MTNAQENHSAIARAALEASVRRRRRSVAWMFAVSIGVVAAMLFIGAGAGPR